MRSLVFLVLVLFLFASSPVMGANPVITINATFGYCSISLNVSSWIINGVVPVVPGSNYSTGLGYFNLTNDGTLPVDVSIQGANMTGGLTWTLSDTATAGNMTYGLKAGLVGGSYNVTVKLNSPYNELVTNLGNGNSTAWGFQVFVPTEFSDGATKSGNMTLTATAA